MKKNNILLIVVAATISFICGVGFSKILFLYLHTYEPQIITVFFVSTASLILSLQGIFTLIWMLYAWENPDDIEKHKSPLAFVEPNLTFTALVPASHEEAVIEDTIKAINNINYPTDLKEIIVLCRDDDTKTKNKVNQTIQNLGNSNITILTFNSNPKNKPHALNIGLNQAKGEIVTVFDAEDEPHQDIYNIINTLITKENVDVVQSGVQLMNYKSKWFSALNVMEYFLWFKSGLHFFAKIGKVTPLGGNTVFFKKIWLERVGGWDENYLTEDADIAIRLTLYGAKIRIVYDEKHVTQEETPNSEMGFINQRTRWNQGFLQILLNGYWLKLPKIKQKIFVIYILTSPLLQGLMFLYMPFGIYFALTQKLPILISLISFIPMYLFLLQQITYVIGFFIFTRVYNYKFNLFIPLRALLTFFPYQGMLVISAFRALYRVLFKKNAWQKTLHTNAHRRSLEYATIQDYVE